MTDPTPRVRAPKRRKRRKPPVGSTPGALAAPEGEPAPKLHAMWFDEQRQGERPLAGPGEISALLADASLTTWIDIEGLGNLDVLREIGRLIDLHPLALADVVNVPQRPKVELYGDRMLFIGHMVFLNPAGGIEFEQVSIVLGPHWVVSFQEKPGDVFDPVRARIRSPQMRVRRMKADFLAYALVDAIVDGYFPVMEKIGEELEALEDEVMEQPLPATLQRLHRIRRLLLQLHRLQWRQRDAIGSLWRDESFPICEPVRLFLRDVYDHAFVVLDTIETYRDLAVSLMDVYLSAASNRLSEVMKTLTLVSTVFIPLTFLVGVYGMNFEYMPELRWRWGYPAIWAVMLAVAAGIVVWFRRKRWLGDGERERGRSLKR
jgi:magnesium transporter